MSTKMLSYLEKKIIWKPNTDPLYPYRVEFDGEQCLIRINDFPDDHLYTLIVNDREVANFDDWPQCWTRSTEDSILKERSTTMIFISYAKEDKEFARKLHNDLLKSGLRPWLDFVDIKPGEAWKTKISKAIEQCDCFILLVSQRSLSKRGHVRTEINEALEILSKVPPSQIYFIPARLDEVEIDSERFNDRQWVDLFPLWDQGLQRILQSIKRNSSESLSEDKAEMINARFLKLTVHKARFVNSDTFCYFVNATNLSPLRDIEVTHVWFECEQQIHLHNQYRSLPKSLKPDESWETWIELSHLPDWVHDNPYGLARARLSTGEVISSIENVGVPKRGAVPGGPEPEN